MAYMLHGNIKVLPVRKAIRIIVKQPSRTDKIRPWVVLFVCFPYFYYECLHENGFEIHVSIE